MLPGITTSKNFNGNDSTRVWTYDFKILTTDGSDLRLFKTEIGGAIIAITASWSVDVANSQVTYPTIASGIAPLALGEMLTVIRIEPITQEVDLVNQGSLDAEVIEAEFDKLTAITQQLQSQIDTGFSVSGIGTSGASGFSGVSESGWSGESGYSGISGVSGASLVSGWSGKSGTSGVCGFSGWSGVSGASLISGYSGFSGIDGFSGVSGSSLVSGWSGISGFSGVDGLSGFSGANPGASGASGHSGYSGIGGGGTQVTSFNSGDINASGWMPVTHGLGVQYSAILIFDNNKIQVIPDQIIATNTNSCAISLGSQGTISGTWSLVIKY